MAQEIGIELKSTVHISDGEIQVNVKDQSVENTSLPPAIQPSSPVNDNLLEILIMVGHVKRAQCRICQCCYALLWLHARPVEKRARGQSQQNSLQACLEVAGVDRLLTIDLHAAQDSGIL